MSKKRKEDEIIKSILKEITTLDQRIRIAQKKSLKCAVLKNITLLLSSIFAFTIVMWLGMKRYKQPLLANTQTSCFLRI